MAGSRARGCIAGCRVPRGLLEVFVGCRGNMAGDKVQENGSQWAGNQGVGRARVTDSSRVKVLGTI